MTTKDLLAAIDALDASPEAKAEANKVHNEEWRHNAIRELVRRYDEVE